MTKYLDSSPFSSKPATKEYGEGWERIFNQSRKPVAEGKSPWAKLAELSARYDISIRGMGAFYMLTVQNIIFEGTSLVAAVDKAYGDLIECPF